MHVLVAPDKFKGSLEASEAARAMALGARRALPEAEITTLLVADGGEGTVDAFLRARPGRRQRVAAPGPLGDPLVAELALLDDGRAVVEMAAASGLALVAEDRRNALRASSGGTGRLLSTALEAGAREVVVGVGGSASTDGGTGAARELGWRFLDARGRELEPGGGALARLARIDGDGVDGRLRRTRVIGACDVDNELLGPGGAARCFAPQKGASPDEVELLEEGLACLAERVRLDLGIEVANRSGAGAGGGMGAGLVAFFGGELCSGFTLVAREVDLAGPLHGALLVITGEGRLDRQSLGGKAAAGVARAARERGVPCLAVVGSVDLPAAVLREHGFTAAVSLSEEVGTSRARSDAKAALAEVTERWVRELLRG